MMETDVAGPDEPDLSSWGLHCFCIGARRTPHSAVTADNNGQILYLARNGAARSELAALGVQCLDSQVALLQMLGMLTVSGEVLRTAFPILGTQAMSQLRKKTLRTAVGTAQGLRPATEGIKDVLGSMNARDHQYAVAFGHGLDGLMWDSVRLDGCLPSTELSVERPYWNGLFWAINPKRSEVAGTNELRRGTETLVTVWTDKTNEALRTMAAAWEHGERMEFVPVIRTGPGDPLHVACLEIAHVVAAALKSLVGELFVDGFGGLTWGHLLLIAGHEFIWDVAQQLCLLGYLDEPNVLRNGALDSGRVEALAFIRSER